MLFSVPLIHMGSSREIIEKSKETAAPLAIQPFLEMPTIPPTEQRKCWKCGLKGHLQWQCERYTCSECKTINCACYWDVHHEEEVYIRD